MLSKKNASEHFQLRFFESVFSEAFFESVFTKAFFQKRFFESIFFSFFFIFLLLSETYKSLPMLMFEIKWVFIISYN